MNKEKKLQLLSNALAAETKVLLAAHFSDEEIAIAQIILIENVERVTTNLFLQTVLHLYKKISFRQFIQKSGKLFWLLRQIRREINALLTQSLCEVKTARNTPLEVKAPLSFNTALLAIINDETSCFFLSDTKEYVCNSFNF